MPHVDLALHQQILYRRYQLQQPQQVGSGRTRAADGIGRLLVRHRKLIDQPLQALRLFQRIEVFALNVLDQRHGQSRLVGNLADQRRHFGEPGQLRRAPAPLAGNDLVAVARAAQGAHENRLHQPLRLDRSGQLFERGRVHLRARLVLARLQTADRQRALLFTAGTFVARQQRVEAAAESLHFHASAPCSAYCRTTPSRRSSNSCASAE